MELKDSRRGTAPGRTNGKYKAKTKYADMTIGPFGLCFEIPVLLTTALLITNSEVELIFNWASILTVYKQGI